MNIILLENLDKVGAKHDVVTVKDGYGRNYLLPRGLALVANRANKGRLEGMKKVAAKKEAAMVTIYKGYASKIEGTTLKITAKAGESGRLFGSITAQHVVNALKTMGIEVDKRIIEMPVEVKELGQYEALAKFHKDVEQKVRFDVIPESAN